MYRRIQARAYISCVVPDGEDQSISPVGDVAGMLGKALPAPLDECFLSALQRNDTLKVTYFLI